MRTLLFPFCFLLSPLLSAQSISGNLNAGIAEAALGYGNVDIYRGNELVASMLTDARGNFNVQLDTGLYRCVVRYDGYKTTTRMVQVKADEQVDFTMAEGSGMPASKTHTTESKVVAGYAMDEAMSPLRPGGRSSATGPPSMKDVPAPFGARTKPLGAMQGVLTAGEVNDFAKWTQWGDLGKKALSSLRDTWGIAPGGRYTVDVQTRQGLPVADAHVQLKLGDGTLLFEARTDNTGKAELWASLTGMDSLHGDLHVEVAHAGQLLRMPALPFEDSVNRLVLDVPCDPSPVVDVAFVVDASGSMQDELDFLKAEMNDIIYSSKQISDRLNFRFANVFYRDAGPHEEYTTRSMDFTRVLSTAVNCIAGQRAGGGGDTPEAVEIALDSAINGLSWSSGARARVLFLVLDAGPHITPAVQLRMRQLVRQAAAKGIRIVPVAASGTDKATEYLMRTLALGTNGTYTFLTDHSGIGLPHTAPSTDRYEVELLNALLVRIIKSYTYMPDCQQQLPDLALDYPDSTVIAPLTADSTLAVSGAAPGSITLQWSFFPNPTTGMVSILANTTIAELYLTDLSGKVLQVLRDLPPHRAVQVDLGAYATGIYLIRFPVGHAWVSGKLVLQRG